MDENDVFTRMPIDQIRKLADHGVIGAKKELERRRKNSCLSVTATVITVVPDVREDLAKKEIPEVEESSEVSVAEDRETDRDGIDSNRSIKKLYAVSGVLSRINPTAEQKIILDTKGRIVKINARAGTGKTATLLMIAQQYADKKIVYLVFNNRNRQEAKGKFPNNVHIHTIHSFTRAISGMVVKDPSVIRPSLFFDCFVLKKEILATLTSEFIVFFLNSIYDKPVDAIAPFNKQLSEELSNIFLQAQARILEISRGKLNAWYKDASDCPHDFYLKMSHLNNAFQKRLSKYDVVLIDEGQDLSPIMINALSIFKGKIIIVGDSHQQIYSFRYAEDAMQKFKHDVRLDLTMSFRFGGKIATLVSKFIQCSKDDHAFKLSGNPEIASQVFFYDSINLIAIKSNTAILSRTNFSMFKNALLLKARKQNFGFGRDITAELYKTLNVYWLFMDEKSKINDDLIKPFKSIDVLEEYATAINDYQLIKIIELVKVYKNQFPGIIFEFLKLCKEDKERKASNSITLSTIHAAKGQEYQHVIIDDDVITRLDVSNGKITSNYFEEINIVYVGMTRAQQSLYLPTGMKKLFNDDWQSYTDRIAIIRPQYVDKKPIVKKSSTIIKKTQPISRRRKGYGAYVKDMPRSKKNESLSTIPDLYVGDTVRSLSGYGHIIKIDGDRCLIAMESQEAKVWERRTTLIKVRKI